MKNSIKLFIFNAILLSLIFGCSVENESDNLPPNENYQLNEKLTTKKTTNEISSLLFNAGVIQLNFSSKNDVVSIKTLTNKTLVLNGKVINFSDYKIIIKNNLLFAESFKDHKITIKNDQPYLITPHYRGYLKDIGDDKLDIKVSFLLLYLNELTNKNLVKINTKTYLSNLSTNNRSCSFWDTYYVYGVGGNEAVAEANLASAIDSETSVGGDIGSDCTAIGGSSTSCVWGGHGCVSTQAYCCNGYVPQTHIIGY